MISSLPPFSLHCPPAPLGGEKELFILTLCAFLARSGKTDGPSRQSLIPKLLTSTVSSEADLRAWMGVELSKNPSAKSYELSRTQALRWWESGIRVAEARLAGFDGICPAVFFIRGKIPLGVPWLAAFNSRKPKALLPDAPWLSALRYFLNSLHSEKIIMATSTGTPAYELVAAHAKRSRLPLVIAAPHSIFDDRASPDGWLHRYGECGVLSCLPGTNACPKARRFVCRDRILAALADIHIVLELRSGGNLAAVLEERQSRAPGPQFIYDPGKKTSENAGSLLLLQKFPAHCRRICPPPPPPPPAPAKHGSAHPVTSTSVHLPPDWGRFLYHYTRSCPGPWPGQSRFQYLCSLLDSDPLSGHSAMDTLARIIMERRIRAGHALVRGREAVVSWTSSPPPALNTLRKWNPALMRWTVEPYGIAVLRGFLRGIGAKPAVYLRDETYGILPEGERYRFQVSASGGHEWRNEREWRSPGDLGLGGLPDGSWFAFVPGIEEKRRLIEMTGPKIPVVAFQEEHCSE